MSITLRESTPVARKFHSCQACEWLLMDDGWRINNEFKFSELRAVVRAKQNGWRIVAGQKYINAVVIWDGDFGVFKAIPEIDAICHKYKIYGEE